MDNHHLQLGTSSNYLGHGFHSKLQQLTREYIAKKGAHHEPPPPPIQKSPLNPLQTLAWDWSRADLPVTKPRIYKYTMCTA